MNHRDDMVKAFVRVAEDSYQFVYSRGLRDRYSDLEYQAELLIPTIETVTGDRVHTVFFNEDALNPGRTFSIRVNFVKREGDK